MTTEPLFILCPGRSFSSIISAVIGQHPQAFGLPEVHLFVEPTVGGLLDVASPLLGRAGAATGLKRAAAELAFGEQTYDSIERAEKWLQQRRALSGAAMFREFCALVPGRVLVDKSPTNSDPKRLEVIYRAFPDARYLHLSRHPYATCRSQYKAYAGRKNARRLQNFDHESHWRNRHEDILAFCTRMAPGQYMFLHGEWFFEAPETFLRQICEWLDLPADEASLAQMMKPELSPFAMVGPDNAKYGNNRGFIESPHLRVGKPKPEPLDGPLEWVKDGNAVFTNRTRAISHQLGYDT